MNCPLLVFGQITVPGTTQGNSWWKSFSSATISFFIVLGVLLLIVVGVFIWAAFIRKPRKRRHSYERWHKQKEAAAESGKSTDHGASHRRRRHRHHHRDRPRNPTLAETGGLPPIRNSQNPPASPPP